MREELLKRMAALNGGDLTEVPEEKPAPPPARERTPRPSGPNRGAGRVPSTDTAPRPLAAGPGTSLATSSSRSFSRDPLPVSPSPLTGEKYKLLEEQISGVVCEWGAHGPHYCVETRLHGMGEWNALGETFRGWSDPPASQPRSGMREHLPERLLFFDIETAGLGDSAVFLIGLMVWDGSHFVIWQLLARGYEEERSILARTHDLFLNAGALVSFNGKSFDLPFVKNRLLGHRLPLCPDLGHIDLLPLARRQWKGHFPDCRLQTLEAYVCGRKRVGDIPSREIPAVYHRYTRDGDPNPLVPILHHNLLDLVTMAELMPFMS